MGDDENDSISGEVLGEGAELNNPETFNLNRILSMMIAESRRRDEMFERVLNRVTPQTSDTVSGCTAPNIQMIPDLQRNVPKFDGHKGAKEWLDKVKNMKTLHQWPDTYALETARSHLEKGAYQWWLSKQNEIDTFDQFETSFKKTFVYDEGLPEKWKRMNERIQQKGEGIHDYFHEKVRLCRDLNLSTCDARKQVLIGLYHKDMCNTMMARRHNDLDDLLHDLNEYIQVDQARLEKIRGKRQDFDNSRRKTSENSGEIKDKGHRSDNNVKKCFNCNEQGHIAVKCKKPKKLE